MGRPSSLQLKFQKNNRKITEVSVGGASVLVCQGKMIIPDGETKSPTKGLLWLLFPEIGEKQERIKILDWYHLIETLYIEKKKA